MVQKQATETVRTAASKAIFAQEVHQGATDAKALWKDRNAVWSEDRAMLQQSYKQRLAGYETVLSNEPRTQFDLAVAILAGQEPIWTLPITIEDPDERHKMNKVERFVRGVMTEADKRWRKRGHNSWLRRCLLRLPAHRGIGHQRVGIQVRYIRPHDGLPYLWR